MPRSYLPILTGSLIASLSCPLPAADWLEDTEAELSIRNYYHYRNFLEPSVPQSKAEEWVQVFILQAYSGFTPGPVGFAADVIGQFGVKLDGGRGTTGTQLLPPGSPDTVSRLGGAARIRYSESQLRIGEAVITNPVLRSDFGRALLQTYEGVTLEVQEIENLTVYAGQIWATSLRNSIDMDDDLSFGGAISDRFRYLGAEYRFNDERTLVGLWGAQLKDIYKQQFVDLKHEQPIGDWVLGAYFGVFFGNEDGSARAGSLDNVTPTGLISISYGNHTLGFSLQRVSGNSPWMRVGATDGTSSGGSLANDSMNASFDFEDERSWGLHYDGDFAFLGYPGLALNIDYIQGDEVTIRSAGVRGGSEWIRDIILSYTVQSGPFKELNLAWKTSSLRRSWRNNSTSDFNEHRVYLTYPLSLL